MISQALQAIRTQRPRHRWRRHAGYARAFLCVCSSYAYCGCGGWLICAGLDRIQSGAVFGSGTITINARLNFAHDTHDTFLLVGSVTDFCHSLLGLAAFFVLLAAATRARVVSLRVLTTNAFAVMEKDVDSSYTYIQGTHCRMLSICYFSQVFGKPRISLFERSRIWLPHITCDVCAPAGACRP